MIKRLLLLPHIQIQNANALSSPFTLGFPAMTAWLGATHALQRKLKIDGFDDLEFKATAVVSHQCNLQTYKGESDYVSSIIIAKRPSFTRKELTKFKAGKAPSFIEDARCHLTISLVIEYTGVEQDDIERFKNRIYHHLSSSMKMAGGDILKFSQPQIHKIDQGDDSELKKFLRKIMPGYALIERKDLMLEAMERGLDGIDAVLDYLAIHHSCEKDDDGNVSWSSKRKTAGWIVPIATGFQGITELAQVKNQRDPDVQHRFAESVVTLGEFKMPHQITSINDILWQYKVEPENNLYLCQQVTSEY
ncbi:type I-F CRISPR-associated protein Csy2 [uncultured Shewanella sp.]|uniref:type I-F CRISPR-associated protein Csy2 n=1 Tax=uncultured Shewanella sp. TaxID=173975 RepID=UPI00263951B6|nr:type I-F CRISPR-associated protein Csy2 [uncultured Shewanella sp.]